MTSVGTGEEESLKEMQNQGDDSVDDQQALIKEDTTANKTKNEDEKVEESPAKRIKLDPSPNSDLGKEQCGPSERRKGVAPIKAELVSLKPPNKNQAHTNLDFW